MKLIITTFEIQNIVREKFGLPAHVEIEVSDIHIPSNLQKAIDAIDRIGIRADNKIECIRKFRDHFIDELKRCSVGLADSKAYIENWDKFKLFVSRTGRMPENCYHTNFFSNYF